MSVSHYTNQVERHSKDIADLESKHARAAEQASRHRADAAKSEVEAGRASSSDSTRRWKARQAEGSVKKANAEEKKAADLLKRITSKKRDLSTAQKNLARAQRQEAEKQEREDRRAREARQKADRRQQREHEQAMADLRAQTASVSARQTLLEQEIYRPPAPSITVLFIAASPEDQQPLRIDKEMREIQHKLRAAEYRDRITFEARLATRTTDLLGYLNEFKPAIVHFSGHGSQHELAFEDVEGNAKPLGNEVLGGLLSSASEDITVALFNSCSSQAQAELVEVSASSFRRPVRAALRARRRGRVRGRGRRG